MKIPVFGCGIALIIPLILWGLLSLGFFGPGPEFFEHNTQIQWPDNATEIHINSDPSLLMSNWVEGHFKLPQAEIDPFIKQYKLIAYNPQMTLEDEAYTDQGVMFPQAGQPLYFLKSRAQFPPAYLSISEMKNLHYLMGNHTGEHRFKLLLDKSSGRVWIQMFYPD